MCLAHITLFYVTLLGLLACKPESSKDKNRAANVSLDSDNIQARLPHTGEIQHSGFF